MPRFENILSQYNRSEIARHRYKRQEICLFFGPQKCMLLQQTVHYLGKYSHLANFLARNVDAPVAALRPEAVQNSRLSRGFLTAPSLFLADPSLCLPNNLE